MTADSADTNQYALKSVQLKEIETPGPALPPADASTLYAPDRGYWYGWDFCKPS